MGTPQPNDRICSDFQNVRSEHASIVFRKANAISFFGVSKKKSFEKFREIQPSIFGSHTWGLPDDVFSNF